MDIIAAADPVTAALNFGTEIIKLIRTNIESQPADLRAAVAKQQWDDFQKWRGFFERFGVK